MKTTKFIFCCAAIALLFSTFENLNAQWQTSGSNIYYSGGNVGIDTNNPEYKLEISGTMKANRYFMSLNEYSGFSISDYFSYDQKVQGQYSYGWYIDSWYPTSATLWVSGFAGMKFFTGASPQLVITRYGNVGIGTTSPDYKLDVVGTVRTHEVLVNTLKGADFVFTPEYRLRPLNEVDAFIKENKHLPDIAPADSMVQDGVNMGEFQIQLLQKIEELTLYIIEQEKRMDEFKKEIETLKRQED